MSDVQQRFDLVLEDLRERLDRAGEPWNAATELGVFVEDLHRAVCATTGKKEDFPIQDWHVAISDHLGQEVKQQQLLPGTYTYSFRNLGTHSNKQRYEITWEDIKAHRSGLEAVLPRLLKLLGEEAFAEEFFRRQNGARQLVRAREVREFLGTDWDYEAVWSAIEPFLTALLPEGKPRGFFRAPVEKRVGRAVEVVASGSTAADDNLEALVELLAVAAPPARAVAIERWRRRDSLRQLDQKVGVAIPVLRLVLAECGGAEDVVLDRLEVEGPSIIGWREKLAASVDLPLTISLSQLGTFLVRLRNLLSAWAQEAGGPQPRWSEWVLRLQVPDGLCRRAFERVPFRGGTILPSWRCIVITPDEDVEFRVHQKPIEHPDRETTSMADWEAVGVDELRGCCGGRECLFTGPNGWDGPDHPPLFLAFGGATAAVMAGVSERNEALGMIFADAEKITLVALLERLTRLRLGGTDLKIIWDDPAMRSHAAIGL